MKIALKFQPVLALLAPAFVLLASGASVPGIQGSSAAGGQPTKQDKPVRIQYLEVVTAEVDATCKTLESLHGVTFGEPVPGLGHARTAKLEGGGRIGVRAPLRKDEAPVVRPYVLVDDIEAAVKAAQSAGGEVAMAATEIPGQGKFAIYFQGSVGYGLWEL